MVNSSEMNLNLGDYFIVDFDDDDTCEILFEDPNNMDYEDIKHVTTGFVYHKDFIIILDYLQAYSYSKIKILTSKGTCGWVYSDYLFANTKFLY